MKITQVIEQIKHYHKGTDPHGLPIDPVKTRDQILYGNTDAECTGIVTCIYASIEVIEQARKSGANLIVCHEALFWNHGDHTDWLADDPVFRKKKALLEQAGVVVFRNHDYVHSGIPVDGGYIDGIFYGLAEKLGWVFYMVEHNPMHYRMPPIKAEELARQIKEKLGYNGIRLIGSRNALVQNVWIPVHILGRNDNEKITTIAQEKVDCVLAYELIDFTVAEYIRDAGQLGENKAIITMGHFNGEQPGMEYMVQYLQPLFPEIPVRFAPCGDMYEYL